MTEKQIYNFENKLQQFYELNYVHTNNKFMTVFDKVEFIIAEEMR